jgi:hypothetical protein
MGWCSGTPIFDAVYKQVVGNFNIPETEQVQILAALADAMEDHDWDCQDDSDYAGEPIFERVMKQLHPDWGEDDEAGD